NWLPESNTSRNEEQPCSLRGPQALDSRHGSAKSAVSFSDSACDPDDSVLSLFLGPQARQVNNPGTSKHASYGSRVFKPISEWANISEPTSYPYHAPRTNVFVGRLNTHVIRISNAISGSNRSPATRKSTESALDFDRPRSLCCESPRIAEP